MHVPFTNFKLNSSLLHYIGLLVLLAIGQYCIGHPKKSTTSYNTLKKRIILRDYLCFCTNVYILWLVKHQDVTFK